MCEHRVLSQILHPYFYYSIYLRQLMDPQEQEPTQTNPEPAQVEAQPQVPTANEKNNDQKEQVQQTANQEAPPQQVPKQESKVLTQQQPQHKTQQKIEVQKSQSAKVQQPTQQTQVEQKKQEKKVEQKKTEIKVEQKKEEPKEAKAEAPKKQDKKQQQNVKTMKCVMLTGPKQVQVREVPIPKPASGEVLIKVMAAPINPSDLALFGGHYSQQKKFPTIMGFEGSGLVVESGGGIMGWGLVGKKVAFGAQKQGQGTYSQFCIAKAEQCLPLADDTPFQQGAMCVVNPLTAIGMLDVLQQRKEKAVVITAAASALGRMMNRLYPQQGVTVINVVRRAEQVELLKSEGAKYILNSSDENFEAELKELAEKVGARTCFQCVGGSFTGLIIRCMPKNSIITLYGCLSEQNVQDINVLDLLFGNKTLNSFMLTQWIHSKNQLMLLPTFYKVRKTITQTLKSTVAKKFKLEQIDEAIKYYTSNMSEGKIIIEGWSE